MFTPQASKKSPEKSGSKEYGDVSSYEILTHRRLFSLVTILHESVAATVATAAVVVIMVATTAIVMVAALVVVASAPTAVNRL